MAKERVERDEEDLVRLYLTDIGQYPLLTKDDEVRLAQAIEAGAAARAELEAAATLTPARKRELRPFELRSLERITGGYEKIVVVRQGSHPTDIDGIKIVSAVDFLMGRLGA